MDDAKSSSDGLKECLAAQVEEIKRHKWNLGVELGRDPLEVRSLNDICRDWIEKYAGSFRKWWEERKQKP